MKNFLFIIPLTPNSFLNIDRRVIQETCFNFLLAQDYSNWSALVIGERLPDIINEKVNFIHINYEGVKEEKLQIATRFISDNKLLYDYIIRLDDDDFFNPKILNQLSNSDFDIYVDKYHTFFEYKYQLISQQIRLWFPNTCIHKFEHAMSIYGNLARADIKKINNHVRLIENDHSKLHPYYKNKKIIFADSTNPLYLRVLNKDSITAKSSINYTAYLKQFGYWKKLKFRNYIQMYKSDLIDFPNINYPLKEMIYRFYQQLQVKLFYKYFLFKH